MILIAKTSLALFVALAALALAGCLSTQNEPFPLDGGDRIAAKPGDYACRSVDAQGVARIEPARLVRLSANRRTQYVFLAPDNSDAEPVTLHRVSQGLYLVALAHEEDPGEDLYLAAPAADGASFRLYAPAPTPASADTLAARNGAKLAHLQFSDTLSGPLAAQRAFALALAADPKSWRIAADCRAKRR
ncbi:MAG: hypothetical protein E7774_13455 [Bradyrhizobium sp.]|nr:MAG: hypothetical protein E7774_13455 [Bradyrhizobium sp.]